ncbi:MAG: CRISPR-associated helicase Cas3' [Calditrichaeota bacterium]|nr:CRISPR-associated helicase Cas3' [Calditrichota bacterium]
MKREFIAHVKQDEDGLWRIQTMQDHLDAVATLAGNFANKFGNRDWGEVLGYWHDLGKFHPAWQNYLIKKSGYNTETHIEENHGRPNHSTAGAVLALEKGNEAPPSRILTYPIAGHHAGLPDWQPDFAGGELVNRLYKEGLFRDDLDAVKKQPAAREFLDIPLPKSRPPLFASSHKNSTEQLHLWIRMLFSCLVDADFLDTEHFMEPQKSHNRSKYLALDELKNRFNLYMENKEKNASGTDINKKRKQIRHECEEKAKLKPGFFSLTVPTGGGKTLSSMAFALEHAQLYNKDRIIVAIPYTSIIEQTAKIFKYGTDDEKEIMNCLKNNQMLFGENQVVEHHSNFDPSYETTQNRLACENWDAPIIVTTNVQLFESLFGARTSSCRKLHNIANSIIILDEVQMLPPEFLKPILSVLKGLVDYFGVTVVLMTATQPAIEGTIGSPPNEISGIENVRSIINDPETLAREFSRVVLNLPVDLNIRNEWDTITNQLVQHPQVLCIVNSRKDCRMLHGLMPADTIHLSGLMCGEERSVVISVIKEKLRKNQPIRVISTQLVEAGVDIDFPVVYRALAGFDSIAQAAGRCNRENKLAAKGKKGQVFVFVPPNSAPLGLLRKGEDACKEILRNHSINELSPEIYKAYFKQFYATLNEVDKPQFYNRLVRDARIFEFSFRTLAMDFKLIQDTQESIIVRYRNPISGYDSEKLIDDLQYKGPNRELMQRLQRFIVNIPRYVFERLQKLGYIEEISGYWVQTSEYLYKPGLGLELDEYKWGGGSSVM